MQKLFISIVLIIITAYPTFAISNSGSANTQNKIGPILFQTLDAQGKLLSTGIRAKEKGITEGVLDIGRQVPARGSKVFAALKGVIDAGIYCPHSDDVLPSEDRILGTHLNENISKDLPKIKTKITGGE